MHSEEKQCIAPMQKDRVKGVAETEGPVAYCQRVQRYHLRCSVDKAIPNSWEWKLVEKIT